MASQREFINRRLHSLLGVIPVGFFLLEHFYTNYHATKGVEAYVGAVEWLWNIPILPVLEIFLIFLPLLYHAVYGLYIVFRARNNLQNFGTFRNYMFFLQRVTGVITLLFVAWHVWQTRIQAVFLVDQPTPESLTEATAKIFQNPVYLTLYIIGIIAVVFHFSNGMWAFLVSWGITIGPRAQMISTWVWMIVFVVLSYMGISTALAFANEQFLQSMSALH